MVMTMVGGAPTRAASPLKKGKNARPIRLSTNHPRSHSIRRLRRRLYGFLYLLLCFTLLLLHVKPKSQPPPFAFQSPPYAAARTPQEYPWDPFERTVADSTASP